MVRSNWLGLETVAMGPLSPEPDAPDEPDAPADPDPPVMDGGCGGAKALGLGGGVDDREGDGSSPFNALLTSLYVSYAALAPR